MALMAEIREDGDIRLNDRVMVVKQFSDMIGLKGTVIFIAEHVASPYTVRCEIPSERSVGRYYTEGYFDADELRLVD